VNVRGKDREAKDSAANVVVKYEVQKSWRKRL